MVASGKMPTISPSRSAESPSLKLADPASRSTGMWCIPRISGPAMRWAKIDSLAMNRTWR